MSLSLRFAATSDVGRVRKDNQDSGYVGPHLIVVADGVGGAARGDIASSSVVESLRKLDVPAGNDALSVLAATVHLAHDRLADLVEGHPELDGTSTTLSAAVFDGSHLQVGHVGDSRGYLLRDGVLQQLTSDHSLVQSLVDEGRITEEEARVHPHRNLILKAIDSVHEPEPDLFAVPLQAGDRILFCTDGCSGVLSNAQMAQLLGGEPLEHASAALVHAALEAGSSDNVTVCIAAVTEGDAPAGATALVVGAAAANPHLDLPTDATNNLSQHDVAALQHAVDPETIRYAPLPPPGRTWPRRLLLGLVVLGLLGGTGYAGYTYSQTRYYPGVEGEKITVNRGIDLDLPLVQLHHEVSGGPTARPGEPGVPAVQSYRLEELDTDYVQAIEDGVDFGSERKVRDWLDQAYCKGRGYDRDRYDLSKLGLEIAPVVQVGNLPSIQPLIDEDPDFYPLVHGVAEPADSGHPVDCVAIDPKRAD